MRFGQTLRQAINPAWKDKYIDYGKLKTLLREDQFDDDAESWTAEDENHFCDEIFNVQLDKVAQFQQERSDDLKRRADAAFDTLKEFTPSDKDSGRTPAKGDIAISRLRQLEKDLDAITTEVKDLKKYSSINYTGFLKLIKKHDRKRGDRYKIRPMMQMRLAQRPFNSESIYSPLINKLSITYYAVMQLLEGSDQAATLPPDLTTPGETHNGERYTAHKCTYSAVPFTHHRAN